MDLAPQTIQQLAIKLYITIRLYLQSLNQLDLKLIYWNIVMNMWCFIIKNGMEKGYIYHSKRFDHRDKDVSLGFVSLIIDARKPQSHKAIKRKLVLYVMH